MASASASPARHEFRAIEPCHDSNQLIEITQNTETMKKSTNGKQSGARNGKSGDNGRQKGMPESQLQELFLNELKDIYWAEKALTKAIPKLIKNATSEELIAALENHLKETEEQVARAEQVFELIGEKAVAKKCEAMAGLIKEAEEIIEDCEEGAMCDAGIISAAQKVEHYEIASYGTLAAFAQTLGITEAADLLNQTLDEEKAADEKLTEVAETAVNVEAKEEEIESK